MSTAETPSGKATGTGKWAVTMAKVRIRRAVAKKQWPRWQLVTFCGPQGGESRGIVDMLAIRKDHGTPPVGLQRGDMLRMILVQVKGGTAARPTQEDADRLRGVARRLHIRDVFLATWKKGKASEFFSLRMKQKNGRDDWCQIENLTAIFK